VKEGLLCAVIAEKIGEGSIFGGQNRATFCNGYELPFFCPPKSQTGYSKHSFKRVLFEVTAAISSFPK
jgi:hypothetical protein